MAAAGTVVAPLAVVRLQGLRWGPGPDRAITVTRSRRHASIGVTSGGARIVVDVDTTLWEPTT